MCTVHTLVDSIDTSIHCCKSQHSIFLYVNGVPVYFTACLVDLHFMFHFFIYLHDVYLHYFAESKLWVLCRI